MLFLSILVPFKLYQPKVIKDESQSQHHLSRRFELRISSFSWNCLQQWFSLPVPWTRLQKVSMPLQRQSTTTELFGSKPPPKPRWRASSDQGAFLESECSIHRTVLRTWYRRSRESQHELQSQLSESPQPPSAILIESNLFLKIKRK